MQKYAIYLNDGEIVTFYAEDEMFAEDILDAYIRADHFEVNYFLEKIN